MKIKLKEIFIQYFFCILKDRNIFEIGIDHIFGTSTLKIQGRALAPLKVLNTLTPPPFWLKLLGYFQGMESIE